MGLRGQHTRAHPTGPRVYSPSKKRCFLSPDKIDWSVSLERQFECFAC